MRINKLINSFFFYKRRELEKMEPVMLTKEQFFSINRVTKYNKILNDIDANIIEINYGIHSVYGLLNIILGLCVPEEQIEEKLHKSKINIDEYIYDNLSCMIGKIVKVLENRNIPIILQLKDAFWDIYIDLNENKFNPPDPNKEFDFKKHDIALESFKNIIIKHSIILYNNREIKCVNENEKVGLTLFICFARSIFELRQFQGPYRLKKEDAIKDSLGRDHLWQEYIDKWDILKYLK
jgi:hypothetical protein